VIDLHGLVVMVWKLPNAIWGKDPYPTIANVCLPEMFGKRKMDLYKSWLHFCKFSAEMLTQSLSIETIADPVSEVGICNFEFRFIDYRKGAVLGICGISSDIWDGCFGTSFMERFGIL
jgi:hypothetical protein